MNCASVQVCPRMCRRYLLRFISAAWTQNEEFPEHIMSALKFDFDVTLDPTVPSVEFDELVAYLDFASVAGIQNFVAEVI